jgi:type IV pilus assembly protein PilW
MKRRHLPVMARAVRGVTLVELMVALVVGLIVSAAAIALFVTHRMTYTASENLGRIQEAVRTGFELMSKDVREAGAVPCDASLSNTAMTNGLNAGAWYRDWNNGIAGYTGSTAFPGGPAFGTAAGNRVAGTEAIEIRSVEATNSVVTANLTDAQLANAITVNTTAGLNVGDMLVVCDYRDATIFQVTGLTSTTIAHAASGTPGNASSSLTLGPNGNDRLGNPVPALSVNGMIGRIVATRWYIGCNGRIACGNPGGRSLFRTVMWNNGGTLTTTNDEIAAGASNMTFMYLPSGANAYVAAGAVTNWPALAAVRPTITFSGIERVGVDNTGSTTITRTVQTVMTVRNHLP